MAFRFKPVGSAFYDLLTQSAQSLVMGADLLAQFFADGADRDQVAEQMREAELRADAITHDIVKRAHASFVPPFDREDIYVLASTLDDCMDCMEAAVDRALLYDVLDLPGESAHMIEVIRRCADLTAQMMPNLRGMADLEEYWIEINRLENAADRHYRRTTARLFAGHVEPLDVLKYKDIIDSLEHAADAFESVAGVIEQIHLKES